MVALNRRSFLAGMAGTAARAALPLGAAAALSVTCSVVAQAQQAAVGGVPLRLLNPHTNESYDVNLFIGSEWNANALIVCDWMMRDWRQNQSVSCDRRLYAALYVIQRHFSDQARIRINSGFRTQQTNQALRTLGYSPAENSLHLRALAVDFNIPGADMKQVARAVAALNLGGTGLYNRQNFVHMDSRGEPTRWGDSF